MDFSMWLSMEFSMWLSMDLKKVAAPSLRAAQCVQIAWEVTRQGFKFPCCTMGLRPLLLSETPYSTVSSSSSSTGVNTMSLHTKSLPLTWLIRSEAQLPMQPLAPPPSPLSLSSSSFASPSTALPTRSGQMNKWMEKNVWMNRFNHLAA